MAAVNKMFFTSLPVSVVMLTARDSDPHSVPDLKNTHPAKLVT